MGGDVCSGPAQGVEFKAKQLFVLGNPIFAPEALASSLFLLAIDDPNRRDQGFIEDKTGNVEHFTGTAHFNFPLHSRFESDSDKAVYFLFF